MRFSHSILFPVVLLLAACKEDAEPVTDTDADTDTDTDTDTEEPEPEADPATFATATEEQRLVAMQAAMGVGPMMGWFAVFQAETDVMAQLDSGQRAPACPAYEILEADPIAIRYSAGGCTSDSGSTYSGVAEAYNMSLFSELLDVVEDGTFDFEGPMKLVFQDFEIGTMGEEMAFDGTFEQSSMAWDEDYTATADLVTAYGGQVFTTQLTTDCAYAGDDATCTVRDGGKATVEGLGEFAVSGSYSLISMTGEIVLEGTDVMRIDLSGSVDGCAPVTIDGVEVEPFCHGVTQPEPAEVEITAVGYGCVDQDWLIDGSVLGEYDHVQAVIYKRSDDGVQHETHPLAYQRTDDLGDLWSASLAYDFLDAGTRSGLACDAETSAVVLQAVDMWNEVLACQVAGDASIADTSACPR